MNQITGSQIPQKVATLITKKTRDGIKDSITILHKDTCKAINQIKVLKTKDRISRTLPKTLSNIIRGGNRKDSLVSLNSNTSKVSREIAIILDSSIRVTSLGSNINHKGHFSNPEIADLQNTKANTLHRKSKTIRIHIRIDKGIFRDSTKSLKTVISNRIRPFALKNHLNAIDIRISKAFATITRTKTMSMKASKIPRNNTRTISRSSVRDNKPQLFR